MHLLWYLILSAFFVPLILGFFATAVWGRMYQPADQPGGIVFHLVNNTSRWGVSYYPVNKFEKFIEILHRKGIVSRTLAESARIKESDKNSHLPLFCITFDDGFEDFYHYVLPVLEKFNVKVTLFPIVSYIGTTAAWDVFPSRAHLSKAQLREIADKGHEIGSHSLTHPDLTMLNQRDLERELTESRLILEDIIGRKVISLSFPYGRWNSRVWNTARHSGYSIASLYGRQRKLGNNIFPMKGAYAFDSVDRLVEKAENSLFNSPTTAQAVIMPHFAKGSTVWKFRKEYEFFH
ncbi:MAG: polysaccharide deacetylase family protein [Chitinivibrionales bacterium]|nr:polysaccharide deacetylase family protein [Chitinivibrionales bacterium]